MGSREYTREITLMNTDCHDCSARQITMTMQIVMTAVAGKHSTITSTRGIDNTE